jgi:hypothetical protein
LEGIAKIVAKKLKKRGKNVDGRWMTKDSRKQKTDEGYKMTALREMENEGRKRRAEHRIRGRDQMPEL